MKRPILLGVRPATEEHATAARRRAGRTLGYTLIEILIAMTLSLLLLGGVIRMFGRITEGMNDSRSLLEMADRLRLTQIRLQQDLAGITVKMDPPRRPEDNEGYFEYIEGPVGVATMTNNTNTKPLNPAVNGDVSNSTTLDTTVGDFDDILMFTTRSTGQPFVGKCQSEANGMVESNVAEVAWFLRGRTLYRRQLLVAPMATLTLQAGYSYYAIYDVSAYLDGTTPVANTLASLTRRECRFAHCAQATPAFPYDVCDWHWKCGLPKDWQTNGASTVDIPTLPTLNECSYESWGINQHCPADIPKIDVLDFWANGTDSRVADNAFISPNQGTRVADDVILTNVIGFDVKAWDPDSRAYVNLGYSNTKYLSTLTNGLGHWGNPKSHLNASNSAGIRVYDTWSTHYETSGTGLSGDTAGRGINGFDDAGKDVDSSGNLQATEQDGVVDSADELLTSPPYAVPLRGIQVKIRAFEPDSRQVREVTVVQEFLSQ